MEIEPIVYVFLGNATGAPCTVARSALCRLYGCALEQTHSYYGEYGNAFYKQNQPDYRSCHPYTLRHPYIFFAQ